MTTIVAERTQVVALYVDRMSGCWVALDSDGSLWSLPTAHDAWDRREPFERTDETELESVPGHYKYMLGLSTH
jgi:hypothetical protein